MRIYYFSEKQSGRTYDYEHEDFKELWNLLKHDPNSPAYYDSDSNDNDSKTYVNLIIVSKIEQPIEVKDSKEYKPKNMNVWNSDTEGGMYHAFINYNKNNEAKTFNELFQLTK